MLFRPTKIRNNALIVHQNIIFICFCNESIQWWWYTCGLYDRENPSIWGSSQLIERGHKCGLTALSWELSTSFPWNTKRPNSFLSPDCGHDAGSRYSGCRTEINCVSYWVTRTGKPLFKKCCFNMGITQIALETSENDLFLTLGSGLPVPKTKI